MPRPRKLLTTREIGERYRVHPRTVIRWILTRGLPATRVGGRWRVEEADIEGFLTGGRFQPPPGPAGLYPSGSPAEAAAAATMSSTTV